MDSDRTLREYLSRKKLSIGKVMHAGHLPTRLAMRYSNLTRAENLNIGASILFGCYRLTGKIHQASAVFGGNSEEECQTMMEILIKKVLESAKPPKGFLGTVRAEELHARLQMDSTENNFTSHYQDIIADISARLWKDKIRKVDIQGTKYPFSPETILQVLSSLQEN